MHALDAKSHADIMFSKIIRLMPGVIEARNFRASL